MEPRESEIVVQGFIEPETFCKLSCSELLKFFIVSFFSGFILGFVLHNPILKLFID